MNQNKHKRVNIWGARISMEGVVLESAPAVERPHSYLADKDMQVFGYRRTVAKGEAFLSPQEALGAAIAEQQGKIACMEINLQLEREALASAALKLQELKP